jgi:hypothetical protein
MSLREKNALIFLFVILAIIGIAVYFASKTKTTWIKDGCQYDTFTLKEGETYLDPQTERTVKCAAGKLIYD